VHADRFDRIARSLTGAPSRRRLLRGLAIVPLGLLLARFPRVTSAKRHKKKPKLNAYGCLNVGQPCGGKDDRCCSGICEGKKSKKGKKDKSKCAAHHTGGCTPERSVCVTGSVLSACTQGGPTAVCLATTGNAAFCATTVGLTRENNCRVCSTDKECEALGYPPGSACLILTGVGCTANNDCNGVNGSSGTACIPPGV
jgi:hypothetical protein